MAQQQSDNEETLSEVNVIPLADLSLVLLIILMVLSPMINQSIIKVVSSKATAAATQEEVQPETPVIVSFAPNLLKLNGTVMGSDLEFTSRLDQVMTNRKDKSVLLTASPTLEHGKVVHLMDVVEHHGAESLVIVKWDEAANAPAPAVTAPPSPSRTPARTRRGRRR